MSTKPTTVNLPGLPEGHRWLIGKQSEYRFGHYQIENGKYEIQIQQQITICHPATRQRRFLSVTVTPAREEVTRALHPQARAFTLTDETPEGVAKTARKA